MIKSNLKNWLICGTCRLSLNKCQKNKMCRHWVIYMQDSDWMWDTNAKRKHITNLSINYVTFWNMYYWKSEILVCTDEENKQRVMCHVKHLGRTSCIFRPTSTKIYCQLYSDLEIGPPIEWIPPLVGSRMETNIYWQDRQNLPICIKGNPVQKIAHFSFEHLFASPSTEWAVAVWTTQSVRFLGLQLKKECQVNG